MQCDKFRCVFECDAECTEQGGECIGDMRECFGACTDCQQQDWDECDGLK